MDQVADAVGVTSAQVAVAWVRQQRGRLIPIAGIRTVDQLTEVLGGLAVALPAEQLHRLDQVSRIEPGFPDSLLRSPDGEPVYGDLAPAIDLPPTAPYRSR